MAAALAAGDSVIANFGFCDDTDQFVSGLQALGFRVTCDRTGGRVEMTGHGGGIPETSADVHCADSGTMLRLITAMCAAARGTYRITASPRLCERPMAGLIAALRHQGTRIQFEALDDHPPMIIHASGLSGGEVWVDADRTSQFASALLMSAPIGRRDLLLGITGPMVSTPYIALTCEIMERFGVPVVAREGRRFIVPAPQVYEPGNITLQPDASTAGYFLAAVALCGGRIRIRNLALARSQADYRITEVLQAMGCNVAEEGNDVEIRRNPETCSLTGGDFDLQDMPDAAPTIAACALFADQPTTIRQVGHLRHKESDRIQGIVTHLRAFGAAVDADCDTIQINPPQVPRRATINPTADHRMAMAMSLPGLCIPGVEIEDPECVSKSCPGYFSMLKSMLHPSV
jgi:3-phosphoshikimate 1-carboxyvinyltransferase